MKQGNEETFPPVLFGHRLSMTGEMLMKRFNYAPIISLQDACEVMGMAYKTGRNQLHLGKFPVKTVKMGGARCTPLVDLIRYMEGLLGDSAAIMLETEPVPPEPLQRKKGGRPRKIAPRAS
jgi:hypothetical protein